MLNMSSKMLNMSSKIICYGLICCYVSELYGFC